MLTVDEVLQKVEEYQRDNMSLEEFENWVEDNSTSSYGLPSAREVLAAIDGALAEYHFDRIGQVAFRKELAKAILPFVSNVAILPIQANVSERISASGGERPFDWTHSAFQPSPLPAVAAMAAILIGLSVVEEMKASGSISTMKPVRFLQV